MKIYYKDISNVIPDNEKSYFNLLEGVINSVDEFSSLEIRKNIDSYTFRISLTSSNILSSAVEELNKLHNLMGIRVDFSKSIKSSCSISYKINL